MYIAVTRHDTPPQVQLDASGEYVWLRTHEGLALLLTLNEAMALRDDLTEALVARVQG